MSPSGRLGRIGIWTGAFTNALRNGGPAHTDELADVAAELEALGYGTLWLGGSPEVDYARPLLRATSRITVATGIVSIWERGASDVAAQWAGIERMYPRRLLLGLGVSHPQLTERYARPYSAMQEYLSGLDSAPTPVPEQARVLAALGPRMLGLSRDRAAGAHPYLVTVEHTAWAREILGARSLLAPELKVVLDTDIDRARDIARSYLRFYLSMPNYTSNLLRLGFKEDDFRDGGSTRLVDAVFALGDASAIAKRAQAFLDAGADHLAVQVVTDDPHHDLPRTAWRCLAETLPLFG
ncbi:LLM class F420-dependent oxidoreductase [Rugosimonospora acidiphila]|uniref:LLM class F420-dependent oxidoreductase n=1 Tax=Rugosimonospora acidiphila TaxID=556531 RepID=A0ABP9RTU1_9ACTN